MSDDFATQGQENIGGLVSQNNELPSQYRENNGNLPSQNWDNRGGSVKSERSKQSEFEDTMRVSVIRGESADEFDQEHNTLKQVDVDPRSKRPKTSKSQSSDLSRPRRNNSRRSFSRGSRQSTITGDSFVKPKYELTEDPLYSEQTQDLWVNSTREDQANRVVCSTHEDAQVIMYCKTCDRLVCGECITSSHKPHDLVETRKQALQDRHIITEKLPEVKTKAIPGIKKNLDTLSHVKAKSTEEFDNMMNHIKLRSSGLITSIEKARDRLISRCVSDKEVSHAFLDKLQDKLSTGLTGLESSVNSSEEALKIDQNQAIVHERIKLQWLLNKYRKSYPHITYPRLQSGASPREDSTLEKMIGYFDGVLKCAAKDQTHKIVLNSTPLGSLRPTYIKTITYMHKVRTACAAGEDKICIVPVVPITSIDIFGADGVSLLTQIKRARIYDITRTMDNNFLITDPKSRKIVRISQQGEIIKWANVDGIPRGVFACKNGDILLCIVDSVDFAHKRRSERYIVRMSESFKITETYGKYEHIFNMPDRVYENANGDICVIDRTGGLDSRLVVLENNGSFRFEYPKDDGFDGTHGEQYIPVKRHAFSDVCCDGYANIYISEERNNEIVVLDGDGKELNEVSELFMKKRDKREENIAAPHRVVVDQGGRLWIIQRRKITLFNLFS